MMLMQKNDVLYLGKFYHPRRVDSLLDMYIDTIPVYFHTIPYINCMIYELHIHQYHRTIDYYFHLNDNHFRMRIYTIPSN